MTLQDLVNYFSNAHNLPENTVSSQGIVALDLGEGRMLHFEEDEAKENVYLTAPLCRLPDDEERLALFEQLMQFHAYGYETKGAYFFASPFTGEVFLCRQEKLAKLSGEEFVSIANDFIQVFNAWRENIEQGVTRTLIDPVEANSPVSYEAIAV